MEGLDKVFKLFFYSMCDAAKWIFAIRMASNVIKSSESADYNGVFKSLMSGGISYGALYSIIMVLDSIKSAF